MRKFIAAVAREIREAIPPMIYFTAVFHAVMITKAAFLADYGLTATGSAAALVGALLVSKAILITDKRRFTNALSTGPLLYNVLWKAAIFSVFTLLFRVIEEVIPLAAKDRSLEAAAQHFFEEVPRHHFWVLQMWLYGSLVMYCLVTELGHRVGVKNFNELLLAPAAAAPRA
jgi:hypothetical protein